MKKPSRNTGFQVRRQTRINWRVTWYSTVLWFLAIIVGGVVVLPWYYLVLPIVIFWTTFFYFRHSDKTLRMGLWISLIWFLIAAILDIFEIIGPYYRDAGAYFSDSRNILKYPFILLTPVVYSLILENLKIKKSRRGSFASVNKRAAIY